MISIFLLSVGMDAQHIQVPNTEIDIIEPIMYQIMILTTILKFM